MKRPPGLETLEAVLEARPASPELLLLPRDWTLDLIRYVRALEAQLECSRLDDARGVLTWACRSADQSAG